MNSVVMGRYFPGSSLVHRFDPRAKMIFLLVWMVFIFLASHIGTHFFYHLFVLFILWFAGIPFRLYWKSIKPVFWIILFSSILHLWMTKGGQVLVQTSFFVWYEEGVIKAVFTASRLYLLMASASLLMFTTSPLDLTDAIEQLLNPLKRLGVPAHELALMMSIALRFIPTLWEEATKLQKAQMARGVDFDSGPIWKRLTNFISILVPLFLSAFRRADELALAMEARGYRGGEGRTKWRELRFHLHDLWLIIVAIVLGGAIFLWG